jgi:hypothetical protein
METLAIFDVSTIIVPILVAVLAGISCLCYEFLLKPYQDHKRLLQSVSRTLIFHATLIRSRRYNDGPPEHQKVSTEVRDLAVQLRLSGNAFLKRCGFIVSSKDLLEASGLLMRISNRMYEQNKPLDEVNSDVNRVGKLLNIDIGSWGP